MQSFNVASQVPPLRIVINHICNFRCKYCSKYGENLFKIDKPLIKSQLWKILDCASYLGIRDYRITGGEPLLSKSLVFEIVDILRNTTTNGSIHLTTNGSKLSPDIISNSSFSKLSLLKISLDTINRELFQNITTKDYLKKIMSSIKTLLKWSTVPIRLNAVVTKENYKGIWDLLNWCSDYNINIKLFDLNGYLDPGYDIWSELFVPLKDIRDKLRQESSITYWIHGIGGYGIPMEQFYWKGIMVTVKDSNIGTTYTDKCNNCPMFWNIHKRIYCQEGIYNLTLTVDGKLIMCRHNAIEAVDVKKSDFKFNMLCSLINGMLDRYKSAKLVMH